MFFQKDILQCRAVVRYCGGIVECSAYVADAEREHGDASEIRGGEGDGKQYCALCHSCSGSGGDRTAGYGKLLVCFFWIYGNESICIPESADEKGECQIFQGGAVSTGRKTENKEVKRWDKEYFCPERQILIL